jgi:hypothetical protein
MSGGERKFTPHVPPSVQPSATPAPNARGHAHIVNNTLPHFVFEQLRIGSAPEHLGFQSAARAVSTVLRRGNPRTVAMAANPGPLLTYLRC